MTATDELREGERVFVVDVWNDRTHRGRLESLPPGDSAVVRYDDGTRVLVPRSSVYSLSERVNRGRQA